MKIYILPISKVTQPDKQDNIYPPHNQDYGVEQDFLRYLLEHKDIVTNDPNLADWHYLPIYWTRWHVNHRYAQIGINELQKHVNKAIIKPRSTFTVCQYDDGPIVDTHGIKQFLASRKSKHGIDIPLLSSSHKLPWFRPRKKYLASFMGRISTHPLRQKMAAAASKHQDILIVDGNSGTKPYVENMLKSYVALCPRGYGGSSFRFYEAMQLGITPFLIGDFDVRPFKESIDWEAISFYNSDPSKAISVIKQYGPRDLIAMGQKAQHVWDKQLSYQKWCNLALKELE